MNFIFIFHSENCAVSRGVRRDVNHPQFVPSEERWYAVLVGRCPGVYQGA